MSATEHLLMLTFRVWLLELPLAAVNYFVMMQRVYEPRVGALRAHRIGMLTRIGWIPALAYLLLAWAGAYSTTDMLLSGLFWVALWVAFEWGGSFLLRRPVQETALGWHVERGYLWPFVLLTYLASPLVVGTVLHPGSGSL